MIAHLYLASGKFSLYLKAASEIRDHDGIVEPCAAISRFLKRWRQAFMRTCHQQVKLRIYNRLRVNPLSLSVLRELFFILWNQAYRRHPSGHEWRAFALHLLDDAAISAVKQAVFGIEEVTDVVAVSYMNSPADRGAEGEIFLNVQRAYARPCRHEWSSESELALYLAHGLDHLLLGDDDREDSGRLRMRRRELRWLRTPIARRAIARLRSHHAKIGEKELLS